jgi:tetratricopeptide (TPR) repeat protein
MRSSRYAVNPLMSELSLPMVPPHIKLDPSTMGGRSRISLIWTARNFDAIFPLIMTLLLILHSQAQGVDASDFRSIFADGVAAQKQGDFQTAINKYREVERLNPQFAPAVFNMGLVLDQAADYSGALESFRKVLEMSGRYPNAQLFLGIEYVRLNKPEQALGPLSSASRESPVDKQPWFWLARAHLALHHNEEAMRAAKRCEEVAPSDASVQFLIASVYMEQQEWKRSEPILTKLAQDFPTVPEIQDSLGMVYFNEARTDLALDKYRSVLRIHPDDLQAQAMLGKILSEQGIYKEAIPYLSAALKNSPNAMDLQLAITEAFWHEHQLDEAVAHAKTAAKLESCNTKPHYLLWRIYTEMKKTIEAEGELKILKKCSKAPAE